MFIVQCPERLNLHNIMPCFCKRHVKTHVCECVLSPITYNHNKHRFCLLSIRCVNILIIIFVLNSYIHDRIDAYLPNCCNNLLWFLRLFRLDVGVSTLFSIPCHMFWYLIRTMFPSFVFLYKTQSCLTRDEIVLRLSEIVRTYSDFYVFLRCLVLAY